jgi:hypothetical protein
VRDNTGARIIFPTKDDEDQELIHIIGKKEAVQAAKEELEKAIKQLVSADALNVFLYLTSNGDGRKIANLGSAFLTNARHFNSRTTS